MQISIKENKINHVYESQPLAVLVAVLHPITSKIKRNRSIASLIEKEINEHVEEILNVPKEHQTFHKQIPKQEVEFE